MTVRAHPEIDDRFREIVLDRDRDRFMGELLRELAGSLEDAIGLDEAEGFIGLVGGRIGVRMDGEYREALGVPTLDVEQVASALVDLKRRIGGAFAVEHIDEHRIVLVNSHCPFGEHVLGRRSLCMMTSNVIGRIGADNLGYGRVELDETIAAGDRRCRVILHLGRGNGGREYFG